MRAAGLHGVHANPVHSAPSVWTAVPSAPEQEGGEALLELRKRKAKESRKLEGKGTHLGRWRGPVWVLCQRGGRRAPRGTLLPWLPAKAQGGQRAHSEPRAGRARGRTQAGPLPLRTGPGPLHYHRELPRTGGGHGH